MISMRRFGIDPNSVSAIVHSHLHADYFGGLPFFIRDIQLVSCRTRPLLIAGPKGLGARLDVLTEAHIPGSTKVDREPLIELIEIPPEHLTSCETEGTNFNG